MGGRRYTEDFVLPLDGVVANLSVDDKGRLIISDIAPVNVNVEGADVTLSVDDLDGIHVKALAEAAPAVSVEGSTQEISLTLDREVRVRDERLYDTLSAGGVTPRATAAIAKPASATAYSIGDHLANNLTATNVTPIEFTVARSTSGAGASGRLTGIRCVASTNDNSALTTANLAFDLLVFRKAANVPFAAGSYPADNDAISIPKAAVLQLVGVFSFTASGWKTSGFAQGVAYQSAKLNSDRPYAPFNLADLATDKLVGVAVMTAAWGASNVAHSFDFILDVEGN